MGTTEKKKGIQKGTKLSSEQIAQRAATRAKNKALKENVVIESDNNTYSFDDVNNSIESLIQKIENIELITPLNVFALKDKFKTAISLLDTTIETKKEEAKKELEEITKDLEEKKKKKRELEKYLGSISE